MLVGILCIIFNIIMYASPLTVMVCYSSFSFLYRCFYYLLSCELMCFINVEQALVIKTKSVKYMPFFLSLANFMNGAIWIVYACLKFDLYILVSFHFHIYDVQLSRYIFFLNLQKAVMCWFVSWKQIPNALGCISGTIQFILYALYYKTTNWSDDDEDKEKSNLNAEIELSQAW